MSMADWQVGPSSGGVYGELILASRLDFINFFASYFILRTSQIMILASSF
jgi:hypothetical protein